MIKYTLYSIQGKRHYQEDRTSVFDDGNHIQFAIIDGHGGEKTAEYIKNYLDNNSLMFGELFKKLHTDVIEKKYEDGACLLICLIDKNTGVFSIAWVGDCVAFHQKKNTTVQLNEIHQLSNPKEIERIFKQTGIKHNPANVYLMSSQIRDFGIMPTRTIGDKDFEKDGVTYEPESITGYLEKGESLILVTDGVTDVLQKDQLEGTATDIVLKAYNNKSSDNISAIKIEFE